MCLNCGGWPWSYPAHLAAQPVKEEHVFLDPAHDFYPDYRVGIHPPAPIYQSSQQAPAPGMYYMPGMTSQPAGCYNNGYYYGMAGPPLATGWQLTSSSPSYPCPATSYNYTTWSNTYSPYSASSMPYGSWPNQAAGMPWCAQASQAQASSYLAMNAAMAAAPQAPYYFVGATPAEIQAQNAYIATNVMQMPQVPTQLVPFKPGSSQQFWVKELDGSWTLREYNDVIMGELGPGHWERHAMSGYFFYIRHPM